MTFIIAGAGSLSNDITGRPGLDLPEPVTMRGTATNKPAQRAGPGTTLAGTAPHAVRVAREGSCTGRRLGRSALRQELAGHVPIAVRADQRRRGSAGALR